MIQNCKQGSVLDVCQTIDQNNLANVFFHHAGKSNFLQLPFVFFHSNIDGDIHLYTVIKADSPFIDLLKNDIEVLTVFNGQSCFVSPTWYQDSNNVMEWYSKSVTITGTLELLETNNLSVMQFFVEQMEEKVERSAASNVNHTVITVANMEQYQIFELKINQISENSDYGVEKNREQKIEISKELKKQSSIDAMLLAFEIEETLKKKK